MKIILERNYANAYASVLDAALVEKEKLMSIKSDIEKEIIKLPEGQLQCKKHRNTYQYWVDGVYASKKDTSLVKLICKREYYDKLLRHIAKLNRALEGMIQVYNEGDVDSIYNSLSFGRKELISDVVYETPEQIIGRFKGCKEVTQNALESEFELSHPINTEIYTMKGENVRSKSEKIIADALFNSGVPYKYEEPLVLNNGRNNTIIHPDFTVLNKTTAKKMYIEHLGMMSDEGYYVNTMNKISLYERNGILIGKNLILFHETSDKALNTNIVNEYIKEYLL